MRIVLSCIHLLTKSSSFTASLAKHSIIPKTIILKPTLRATMITNTSAWRKPLSAGSPASSIPITLMYPILTTRLTASITPSATISCRWIISGRCFPLLMGFSPWRMSWRPCRLPKAPVPQAPLLPLTAVLLLFRMLTERECIKSAPIFLRGNMSCCRLLSSPPITR